MYKSNKQSLYILFGLFSFIGIFGILPDEFIITALLFTLVTRGGMFLIKSATNYDLKNKETNKT